MNTAHACVENRKKSDTETPRDAQTVVPSASTSVDGLSVGERVSAGGSGPVVVGVPGERVGVVVVAGGADDGDGDDAKGADEVDGAIDGAIDDGDADDGDADDGDAGDADDEGAADVDIDQPPPGPGVDDGLGATVVDVAVTSRSPSA